MPLQLWCSGGWHGGRWQGRGAGPWARWLALGWLCHHVTFTTWTRDVIAQISVTSSRAWRVKLAPLCFFHLKPYCTLPITMPTFHLQTSEPHHRKKTGNSIALKSLIKGAFEQEQWRHLWGKTWPMFCFPQEEKVWGLCDLNWCFQLEKGCNG